MILRGVKMLKANYHTHTKRCGHAFGEDEEYVLEALGQGMVELGFSDHIMLPGFSQRSIGGEYSLWAQDYFKSINYLKEKYKDRMKIYLGYEAESFQLYFPYYRELLSTKTVDYLILGNHCRMNESKEIVEFFGKTSDKESMYKYRDLAISALKTGLFSYFAHPDYFMSSIEVVDKDVRQVCEQIIDACIENNVVLEINTAGIRNGLKKIGNTYRYIYPNDDFFEIAGKKGAKCIIGLDAHAPSQISNEEANIKAIRFAKKHGLNLVDTLKLD